MAELTFERVSRDYWNVRDDERLVGQIIGGGPTPSTKYKAVCDGAEETEPLGYGYTKEQAGQYLLDC